MKIRMANLTDMSHLIRVRFDYFSTENMVLEKDMKERIRNQLQEYYTTHLNADFFAAFMENETGTIVSTAFLVISEKPANLSWPTGKTGLILNVLTYSEYRNKGYATNLLNFLIEKAKELDVSYLELSASELGKSVYKNLGFHEKESSHFTEMKMDLI